ncbi:MAG: tetratricopeptide repeat protein [Pseudomonadales bacterium]|nr:tetratricopeptide repeat protein [Pseudomonadales bacterium]
MLTKSFVHILSALMLVGLLAACSSGEDRQEKYLERSQAYFDEGDIEKARIEARNVLQINPKNIAARQLLGEISYEDGDIRKAYGMFLSVLDESPDNVAANTAMAKIYVAVKDYDKTIEHANSVLAVNSEDALVLGYKALALAGQGDIAKAEEVAAEALSIDAGSTEALGVMVQKYFNEETVEKGLAILERGQLANPDEIRIISMKISLLESMGDAEAVEAELIGLANKFPEEARYTQTLAKYYVRESNLDAAEVALRGFAETNEDDISAKLSIISFLLQQRSQEQAIKQAEEYLDQDKDQSKFSAALAQLHLFTGDKDSAVNVLEAAVDRDPRSVGSIEARNILVTIYLQEESMDKATNLISEVLEIEPENADALLIRARLSLSDGQIKDGISDLRVILKNDPGSIVPMTLLAQAQELEGSAGLALDNYKKLMTLQKPDLSVLTSAARLAISSEQYQEAESYIRQALELEGDNASLVTNLVKLLVLKEDWDAARSFANRLVASEKSSALGYFLMAGLDTRLEDNDSAIKNLKASLKAEPKGVESLTGLSSLITQQSGLASAVAFVGEHCESYPKQAHCHHIFGGLLAQSGNLDQAIAEYETALSLNDQLLITYRQLAKVYGFQRNKEGVIAILERGIAATEDQGLAFDMANFYYQVGDFQKSSDIYVAMIDTDENALSAKNNLAMLYAEFLNTPENIKKANALIADLQDSENPAFLDTVGWVLYLTGEYDRAVTYLQAAVDQVGSSGLLQYHLGMAFSKLDDSVNAKVHLELAVKDGREDPAKRFSGFDVALATLENIE